MKKENDIIDILTRPLEESDVVEWRILQFRVDHQGTPRATVSAYFQSRTAMRRLDEAFGIFGWDTKYTLEKMPLPDNDPDKPAPYNVICHLTVRIPKDGGYLERVVTGRSPLFMLLPDAAFTDDEIIKSNESYAFRRAAVEIGIGRELYFIKNAMAKFHEDGRYLHFDKRTGRIYRWDPPSLKELNSGDYQRFTQSADEVSNSVENIAQGLQAAFSQPKQPQPQQEAPQRQKEPVAKKTSKTVEPEPVKQKHEAQPKQQNFNDFPEPKGSAKQELDNETKKRLELALKKLKENDLDF